MTTEKEISEHEDFLLRRYKAFKTALQFLGNNQISEVIRKEVQTYEEDHPTNQELNNMVDEILDSLEEMLLASEELKKLLKKMDLYEDSGVPGPGYVNQDPDLH